LLTPYRHNPKSVYTLFQMQKVGVHIGITFTNKNDKYDEINYWLLRISLTYHDASRQRNLYHYLFVYW
jgi:hypothetical protein